MLITIFHKNKKFALFQTSRKVAKKGAPLARKKSVQKYVKISKLFLNNLTSQNLSMLEPLRLPPPHSKTIRRQKGELPFSLERGQKMVITNLNFFLENTSPFFQKTLRKRPIRRAV